MKDFFCKIKDNPLFAGIDVEEFEAMMGCVRGRIKKYEKDGTIQLAGDPVDTVGVVVSGQVQVAGEDEEGRRNLMAELGEGEMFGEVFACAGIRHSPVTVTATEPSQILHINYSRIITTCSSACKFHQRLIENMLSLMAQKTLMLNQKITILSRRTIRERLLIFFDFYRKGAGEFTIPYTREELAAYLCIDRSAMSAELSRMQKDGLIRYDRNRFEKLGQPSSAISSSRIISNGLGMEK